MVLAAMNIIMTKCVYSICMYVVVKEISKL